MIALCQYLFENFLYHLDITLYICYTTYKGDDIMSISKDNTRMILTIPKELKAELERIAQEQNRSVNNLILTIIKNSISNTKN